MRSNKQGHDLPGCPEVSFINAKAGSIAVFVDQVEDDVHSLPQVLTPISQQQALPHFIYAHFIANI